MLTIKQLLFMGTFVIIIIITKATESVVNGFKDVTSENRYPKRTRSRSNLQFQPG